MAGRALRPPRDEANKGLIELIRDLAEELCPDLRFTSILVNKDNKYGIHTDEASIGSESAIIGLGEFRGGELVIFDPSGEGWRRLDVRNQLHRFHPRHLHYTAESDGERLTIVLYVNKAIDNLSDELRAELTKLRFPLPNRDELEDMKRELIPPSLNHNSPTRKGCASWRAGR